MLEYTASGFGGAYALGFKGFQGLGIRSSRTSAPKLDGLGAKPMKEHREHAWHCGGRTTRKEQLLTGDLEGTLNPKPQTLNPKPSTLNPNCKQFGPEAPNPKHRYPPPHIP